MDLSLVLACLRGKGYSNSFVSCARPENEIVRWQKKEQRRFSRIKMAMPSFFKRFYVDGSGADGCANGFGVVVMLELDALKGKSYWVCVPITIQPKRWSGAF
mmetsp:Transcript_32717/g.44287  ORF Transcript_32717/g.44287 Transcript_32717/m.44287 type:complete len:102 (-) Transcript_32717:940-1245(-)